MQFSTFVFAAALVSGALAAPLDRLSIRAGSCNAVACAAALAPAGISCTAAGVEVAANPLADAACVAAAANVFLNTPASCVACAQAVGLDDAFNKIENAVEAGAKKVVNGAVDVAKSAGNAIGDAVDDIFKRSCNAVACAAALAPAGISCTAAAVEVEANPLADAACVASAANVFLNTPASCTACAAAVGLDDTFNKIENAVESGAKKVVNGAKGVASDIGDAVGDLF